MVINSNVKKHLDDLFRRCPALEPASEKISFLYITLKNVFFNGKTLFCCGNGGSYSDVDHLVGELGKSFLKRRPLPDELRRKLDSLYPDDHLADFLQCGFRAMTLSGQSALATAYMNDVDPMMIYAQQLLIYGCEGDAVMGFTTSGKSVSICNAFKVARAMGITTILMTGDHEEGICRPYADVIMDVPGKEAYIVQEYHLPLYHTLAIMLEEEFYGGK